MKRGFALRFCYGAKGVEKHGENSQIIGGGRRSDAAGGALFALTRQWVYAALIWAGALGCLAAALNFRGKAKDAHQHEDEQV